MGQPVVHFEVVGRDAAALQSFYAQLFGWQIDANNPMQYGIVNREGNTNADGVGSAAASAPTQRAMSPFTSKFPTWRRASPTPSVSAAPG